MLTSENATHKLEIWDDTYAESPREWESPSTFVTWQSNYNSPDKNEYDNATAFLMSLANAVHPWFSDYYRNSNDPIQAHNNLSKILEKHYLILDVYVYEHGGIAYSTSEFSCPWDSGQCGYIYVPKKKALLDWENEKQAIENMESEVNTYSSWANGEVYGFTISERSHCKTCGHVDYEVIDSCGGFIGSDYETNGMTDNMEKQFHAIFDDLV